MNIQEKKFKPVLSRYEEKIVLAFTGTLLGLPEDELKSVRVEFIQNVNRHLRNLPFDKRFFYRVCLWIFELLAITYYGSFRLMSRMEKETRSRYLRAWHDTWWSVKRNIKRFVEAIVTLNYYTIPKISKKLGFDPVLKEPFAMPKFSSENLIVAFPKNDQEIYADVCVIGSGAGGAVVAKELAEKGHSVVLLEEGAWFEAKDFSSDTMEMVNLLYREAGTVNTYGWPVILIPVGRCVGGTTLINCGTCFRAPDSVLEGWVDNFGLAGWEAEKMRPYFERIEKTIGVESAKDELQGASGRIVCKGFKTLGYDVKPLERNVPNCCGSGLCVQGCPTNAKQSTNLSYLPLAMSMGTRVFSRVKVHRIKYSRRHATSVEGRFIDPVTKEKGGRINVNAKIIVVACGTLFSPLLLSRSFIPNPSGQRGRNLSLHPASKIYALFDEEVKGWEGIPQGYYSDALKDKGVKFEGVFLSPSFTAATVLLMGKDHREVMENYSKIACFGLMISDETRGHVLPWLGDSPFIWYNIRRRDLNKYRMGYKLLTEAFFAAGAKKVFPGLKTLPVITREEGSEAVDKLKLRNKDLDLQAFHPLGTCRMGADPRDAVVDGYGRVYGLDNLFVADGSIFPTSLGVNPMLSIMAAANKIADNIHREHL